MTSHTDINPSHALAGYSRSQKRCHYRPVMVQGILAKAPPDSRETFSFGNRGSFMQCLGLTKDGLKPLKQWGMPGRVDLQSLVHCDCPAAPVGSYWCTFLFLPRSPLPLGHTPGPSNQTSTSPTTGRRPCKEDWSLSTAEIPEWTKGSTTPRSYEKLTNYPVGTFKQKKHTVLSWVINPSAPLVTPFHYMSSGEAGWGNQARPTQHLPAVANKCPVVWGEGCSPQAPWQRTPPGCSRRVSWKGGRGRPPSGPS